MNKKGDASSLIISLIVILFAIAVASLLFSKVFLTITGEMKTQEGFSNLTKDTITKVESKTIPLLDYLFLFSFIAIAIGLIISSIYLEVHPALTLIFMVVLVIAVVLSGIFANSYVEVAEEPELLSTYNQFTFTKLIMGIFPTAVLIIGALVIFVLYGKGKGGNAPI